MTLIWIILAAAIGMGLIFALISLSFVWLQRQAGRQFEEKFQDANHIAQSERPPPAWRAHTRQLLQENQARGQRTAQLDRVGNRAKKRYLRQLQALIGFLENGRFYDSLATRQELVDRLKDIHAQWQQLPWEELIEP
ncbi:MAG: hypothetical protein KF832_09425 [Caldilineaceae bacterium]|nr:hypothetical protein [Caldilineaceae bacterium]